MIKQLYAEITECHPILSSRKPLAIGIKHDLKEIYPGIRSKDLWQLMSFICRNNTYLKNTIEGNPRYSLDGTESGTVTVDQAAYAQSVLAQRKQDKKKQATPCVSTPEIKQAKKVPDKPQRFDTVLTLKKNKRQRAAV